MRTLIALTLKSVVVVVALALPLLGAWIASSMAAYANGPRWVAGVAGLLGFPILPGLWELVARIRRARKKNARPPILTTSDRLWLRTLAVNALFFGGLLATKPVAAVRAISARGDWMLDGRSGEDFARARDALHHLADAFGGLYARAIAQRDAVEEKKHEKEPAPLPRVEQIDREANVPEEAKPVPALPTSAAPGTTWPLARKLAPSAVALRREDETSLEAAARALVANEPSDEAKVKALHDWAADRIAYDVPSYETNQFAPQDAEAVFQRRTGVCAGYANLLEAMGKVVGLDIAVVRGHAKGKAGEVDGRGHAWNRVRLGDRAYLLDATWDAGFVMGSPGSLRFEKHYRTDYLFTPPEVFGVDHFPEEPENQLRAEPISRGDFMRTPQLTPDFFARGLVLTDPTRSQVTVQGSFVMDVDTSHARPEQNLLSTFEPKLGGPRTDCNVVRDASAHAHVRCEFPGGEGTYRVLLYASPTRGGTFDYVGEIEAQTRP